MSKPKKKVSRHRKPKNQPPKQPLPVVVSLLDRMEDGREFESLVALKTVNLDMLGEIRKSLAEISAIRGRPAICVLSNMVNPQITASTSIDLTDDLPFSEMIAMIPAEQREIDIILVTPGGSGEQVAKFVDKLRPRFDRVSFILPYMAMSAGTIFAMSGNEIIMGNNSYIGPTDPQVPNREGQWVPAQAILTLINDIQTRGEQHLKNGQNPLWTDLQLLKQLDGKDIGNALNQSKYSMELVEDFLFNYKFADWSTHSSTNEPVTDEQKRQRAQEIAGMLCSHAQWKTHSRGIPRNVAWNSCKIKIIHTEDIDGLDRVVRRFWALMYWVFENTPIYKMFISDNYCIFRQDKTMMSRSR